ncbi:hypothetical protein C8R43DRAFT_982663 [Mycena crocata]|nr:hypothetical protein C8R43DRAFT_982663 [Mycena crocata]
MSHPADSYSAMIQRRSDEFYTELAARRQAAPSFLPDRRTARPRQNAARPSSARIPTATRAALFCGSEIPLTSAHFYEPSPPPIGSFLGIYAGDIDAHSQSQPRAQKPAKSNGCGTQVHDSAIPHVGSDVWTGNMDAASTVVVALEAKYVLADIAGMMAAVGAEPCGCAYEYIGCAVCGNPLGMLFTPCSSHRSPNLPGIYSFLPSAVSPPLPPASSSSSSTSTATSATPNPARIPPTSPLRSARDEQDQFRTLRQAELDANNIWQAQLLARARIDAAPLPPSAIPGFTTNAGGATSVFPTTPRQVDAAMNDLTRLFRREAEGEVAAAPSRNNTTPPWATYDYEGRFTGYDALFAGQNEDDNAENLPPFLEPALQRRDSPRQNRGLEQESEQRRMLSALWAQRLTRAPAVPAVPPGATTNRNGDTANTNAAVADSASVPAGMGGAFGFGVIGDPGTDAQRNPDRNANATPTSNPWTHATFRVPPPPRVRAVFPDPGADMRAGADTAATTRYLRVGRGQARIQRDREREMRAEVGEGRERREGREGRDGEEEGDTEMPDLREG